MPTQITEETAQPRRDEIELSEVLHALSDPVRLKMVAALADSDEASADLRRASTCR